MARLLFFFDSRSLLAQAEFFLDEIAVMGLIPSFRLQIHIFLDPRQSHRYNYLLINPYQQTSYWLLRVTTYDAKLTNCMQVNILFTLMVCNDEKEKENAKKALSLSTSTFVAFGTSRDARHIHGRKAHCRVHPAALIG